MRCAFAAACRSFERLPEAVGAAAAQRVLEHGRVDAVVALHAFRAGRHELSISVCVCIDIHVYIYIYICAYMGMHAYHM